MIVGAVPVVDSGVDLRPDPSRVITKFFVAGHEDVGPGDSRAAPVIERILRIAESEVDAIVRDVDERFADRHASLGDTFERHAGLAAHRLDPDIELSPARRRLLGAAFTHEYSVEAAALCNPSIVAHPDQPDNGDVRFVMSVRCVGEGHRSSIGFRTGTISALGPVIVDPPGRMPRSTPAQSGIQHRGVLHRKLAEVDDDYGNAAFVLDALPAESTDGELRVRMDELYADSATRRNTAATISHLDHFARCSYAAEFDASATEISERVLWPQSSIESHGLEDARFVEITDGSAPRYCATYTAFDGVNISQNLLTTEDFVAFQASPMAGAAARGKGLALFPRKINGRFVALSRADRETNSIAFSDDLRCWDTSETVQTPDRPWEILQLGNCGSPIETAEGWLVLTHGVGPMRTYSIGAILLDLEEPQRVVGTLDQPLLAPGRHQRDGYVPNVVYTCGAMAVGDRLVVPYGIGDQRIAVATVSIADLLGAFRPVGGARSPRAARSTKSARRAAPT